MMDKPDYICLVQAVSECYEDVEPGAALEKLMGKLSTGRISEESLLRLLQNIQRKALLTFPPPLASLLEDLDGQTLQGEGREIRWDLFPVICGFLRLTFLWV